MKKYLLKSSPRTKSFTQERSTIWRHEHQWQAKNKPQRCGSNICNACPPFDSGMFSRGWTCYDNITKRQECVFAVLQKICKLLVRSFSIFTRCVHSFCNHQFRNKNIHIEHSSQSLYSQSSGEEKWSLDMFSARKAKWNVNTNVKRIAEFLHSVMVKQ